MPTPLTLNPGIRRGMWASARRRHPTTGGISQGLQASDVACAHLANDVGNRHAASAKASTHKPWNVRMAGRHRPWPTRVGQQQATSTKAYTHKPWPARIGCALHASADGRRHRSKPARFKCDVCASGERCRPTTCNMIKPKASTNQSWHVHFGKATSSVACAHRLGDIGFDLRASVI